MLKIENVNKFFNKNKKNEIHVINNTSLTLEDNGLVALLGPSGCGKTTLLNCIGGLDKIKSGSIYINDQKISSKFAGKVDRIRNLNVGYIFQDYKLIDNMSVYENVALVLTMIGIKDKNEVKKRVEYVLDKVGMLRYKRRPAGMLSGGERQRVGIARAIVKDPNIILADEPTGNLDSKNSLEVMKIIKAISKDRLVILVTHEQSLAKFYASRVIEIKDGEVIDDYINDHADNLDYELDNTFYLKDLDKNVFNDDKHEINVYNDEKSKQKIKLDIVINKGNIYIKSNTKDKIEVIDDNSSIEMIDDHYKQISKNDIDTYNFNLKDIINNDIKKKYSSIYNPLSLIIKGFKKVFEFSFLKKILLIGFVLSGMFIMYAISSIGATLKIDDKNFVTVNKNYLAITQKIVKVDDYLKYEDTENINYILPGNSRVTFFIKYNYLYQTANNVDNINGSLSSISLINKDDLLYGRMPENDYEIVVDKMTIDSLFQNEGRPLMSGLKTVEEFIDKEVTISNMKNFKIVGITDLSSPSIYASENNFINIIANSKDYIEEANSGIYDYNLFTSDIVLKEGRLPLNDYEVIVNISNKESMKLNKEISVTVNDKKLVVVGYYFNEDNLQAYLVNNNTIKYLTITQKENITILPSNKEAALDEFRSLGLNINDSYTSARNTYQNDRKKSVNSSLLAAGIILFISLVEIFLMIRASFLSRTKEVGILRAIGVKKADIYKMFLGEIIAITTLACIPGLIFMAYALHILSGISYLSSYFMINVPVVSISILFIYLFNIVIGLFPVYNAIRKRPAAILARHDLD